MKAKRIVQEVEYWLEGVTSCFCVNKKEFYESDRRGFYILKFTDGSSSNYIYKN